MRHPGDAQKYGVKSNASLTEMIGHTYTRAGVNDATRQRNMWMDCGRHVREVCRGWGRSGHLVFDQPLWQPMTTHVAEC